MDDLFNTLIMWASTNWLINVSLIGMALAVLAKSKRAFVLLATLLLCLCEGLRGASTPYVPGRPVAFSTYVYLLCVLVQGLCVIKIASIALFQVILPSLNKAPPRIMQDVGEAGVFITWALILMSANGVDATGVLTTSAILTAVIGLSFQDTLGNIISGLAIQFDRSIRVGDWVRIDGLDGKISEIRWRYTALQTRNWETVLIPNSFLAKNRLMLLGVRAGQPTRWRRWVWFNVDFRYHPTKVIEVVERGLLNADIPRVANEPPLNCVLMDLGESYARYAVRYWLDNLEADDPVDSAVREHLYIALERNGIPLSMPAQAVFLTAETAERKEQKLSRDLAHRKEALHKVEMFKDLTDEEIDELASHLVPAPFIAGDLMTRQGSEAHWLYMIVEGKADVIVTNESGQSEKIAELGDGGFFGEMGLMTGAPRRATVVARSQMRCYRLDKDSFSQVLLARPALAEQISKVLAQRNAALESTLQQMHDDERRRRLAASEHDILGRIKALFGLSS